MDICANLYNDSPAIVQQEQDFSKYFPTEAAIPFGSFGPAKSLKVSFLGVATNAADQQTYDFGNFSAPAAGILVVGIIGRRPSSLGQITSASIGGTTVSIFVQGGSQNTRIGFAQRYITAAGNVNVSVTFDTTMSRGAVYVWFVENSNSSTAYASGANTIDSGSNSTSAATTFDVPANGYSMYIGTCAGKDIAMTWTNATEIDERFVEINLTAAAFDNAGGSTASRTVTVSYPSQNGAAVAGVSYR